MESERAALQTLENETKEKLLELEPTALDVRHTLVGLPTVASTPIVNRRLRNPDVAARNAVIDAHLDQPNKAICGFLDFELMKDDKGRTQGINESWGVNSYCEAYEKCSHPVDEMIYKRRRKPQSPQA